MKKCILTVGAVVLVIAVLLFSVFYGFNLGFLDIMPIDEGITLGLDLVGGSEIVYEALVPEDMSNEDLAKSMDAVQAMLRERLNSLGYTEANVYLSGDRGVTVEIPNVTNPEQAVQMLGSTAVIEFQDYQGNVLVSGEDIESATAAYMPVGTGGKAMLLLSGGIDSPVAGYMIAKRGVKLDAVYFHAPPYTSDRAKQKVVDLARLVSKYTGPIYLHVINFTDIQLYIYEQCPHDELTIIMRRYMMRIAETIAQKTECLGLITGESIGQVASQTMASLVATNEVCELPVYRPLIGFDKQEIVEVSEKIGTYETSILPYEDCCTIFVAKHPVTKPSLNVIRRHEKNLEEKIDELVQIALDTDEVIVVSE